LMSYYKMFTKKIQRKIYKKSKLRYVGWQIMSKPRDENKSSKKTLDENESKIVGFLEKTYDRKYTKEDIIKDFPEIDKSLIPILLNNLAINKIIDEEQKKGFLWRKTLYYMAKKR
jgi:hypothetical protein